MRFGFLCIQPNWSRAASFLQAGEIRTLANYFGGQNIPPKFYLEAMDYICVKGGIDPQNYVDEAAELDYLAEQDKLARLTEMAKGMAEKLKDHGYERGCALFFCDRLMDAFPEIKPIEPPHKAALRHKYRDESLWVEQDPKDWEITKEPQ